MKRKLDILSFGHISLDVIKTLDDRILGWFLEVQPLAEELGNE